MKTLIEETLFSPLYILASFVIDYITIGTWIFLGGKNQLFKEVSDFILLPLNKGGNLTNEKS